MQARMIKPLLVVIITLIYGNGLLQSAPPVRTLLSEKTTPITAWHGVPADINGVLFDPQNSDLGCFSTKSTTK